MRRESDLKEILERNAGLFLDFETFAIMKKALEKMFSSGALVIIATMAKPCGQKIYKQIIRNAKTNEEALNQLAELLNDQNWGELSLFNVDFERGSGKVIVKNCFEARQHQSGTPCCRFFSSFLAGFMSELLAKNVMIKEEKCAATGNAYCEFKF